LIKEYFALKKEVEQKQKELSNARKIILKERKQIKARLTQIQKEIKENSKLLYNEYNKKAKLEKIINEKIKPLCDIKSKKNSMYSYGIIYKKKIKVIYYVGSNKETFDISHKDFEENWDELIEAAKIEAL